MIRLTDGQWERIRKRCCDAQSAPHQVSFPLESQSASGRSLKVVTFEGSVHSAINGPACKGARDGSPDSMALHWRLFRELQLQRCLSVPRIEERTPNLTTDRRRVRRGVNFPYREREL
jgi:hypothetical protein